ncbi:hypothetical protein Taro_007634 [Colocasia esculenta]|uniref:Non-haem dioxygenase N-terminal domain-containing protein n=1 Tax=Colocasia esculenta TaxID=4460 RepID=A0A843TYP9_COLES|nr:hypothetical protein [Colocasia esculenta]
MMEGLRCLPSGNVLPRARARAVVLGRGSPPQPCAPVLKSSENADAIEQPVIDLASLHRSPSALRSLVVGDIGRACRQKGFFQVVNHGINSSVMNGALESAAGFFSLPMEDKMELVSDDVRRPVRCGSSKRCDGQAAALPQRSFLKQYVLGFTQY